MKLLYGEHEHEYDRKHEGGSMKISLFPFFGKRETFFGIYQLPEQQACCKSHRDKGCLYGIIKHLIGKKDHVPYAYQYQESKNCFQDRHMDLLLRTHFYFLFDLSYCCLIIALPGPGAQSRKLQPPYRIGKSSRIP